jgi:hypothetical protein
MIFDGFSNYKGWVFFFSIAKILPWSRYRLAGHGGHDLGKVLKFEETAMGSN